MCCHSYLWIFHDFAVCLRDFLDSPFLPVLDNFLALRRSVPRVLRHSKLKNLDSITLISVRLGTAWNPTSLHDCSP
jgi:hypothetical protein